MKCETNRIGDDNLQLIDFSVEDDYLIAFPFRDSLEDLRLSVTFDNVNEGINHVQSESVEPRRPSFLRKSLAWDSAFFTSAGVLSHEELFMINKGFRKGESNQPSPGSGKDVNHNIHKLNKRSKVSTNVLSCKKTNSCSQNKVKSAQPPKNQSHNLQGPKDKASTLTKLISSKHTNNATVEGSENSKLENKTRKAGTAPDLSASKKSRWGDLSGLPKSTSFSSPTTQKDSKVHQSSSKKLLKSIKRNNTKPTTSPSSVHFPLSSTCSSTTSPGSSTDEWVSESLSSTSAKHQNVYSSCDKSMSASDFQTLSITRCQDFVERKFTCQSATRSSTGTNPSLFSGGPKSKIKSSGLRMPSPKIGFFDQEQPLQLTFRGSMQSPNPLPNEIKLNESKFSNLSPSVSTENISKARKNFSSEHDGRKIGSSCSNLKANGHIQKEMLKNKMNLEKHQDEKENQKVNVCSLEDQANVLSRYLEIIDLDRDDVSEVKVNGQHFLPSNAEHTTPCSRIPLAEKMLSKR